MKIDFTGKTVLITGATRGIGKKIADDMEQCGARLILTSSKTVDFRDQKATQAWITDLCRQEKIDVCINNAGINKINPIDEVKDEDWEDISKVNLDAPLVITREVSRGMKARRYGRIVNMASIFGTISKAKRSLYSMSKFGLRGLTIASGLDLAPYNVLVNAVSPGFVSTELSKSILSTKEMAELASQVPLGRFAEPGEISKVVLFLASELNTYITAQNIVVDGGFTHV